MSEIDNNIEFEHAKQRMVNRINELLTQLEGKIEELKNIDSNEKLKERQKEYYKEQVYPKEISRIEGQILDLKKQLSFYRPSNQSIEDYNKKVLSSFSNELLQTIPEDLHLLFHGTSIYHVKDIIDAGGLSSPGERGQDSNITSDGTIWVTSKYTGTGLNTTLSYAFLENSDKYTPPGCIFALKTDEQTEYEAGKMLITPSISFADNPDILYSIITVPENVEMIKRWCAEKGIYEQKVQSYDSFLEYIQNNNKSL